MEAPPKDRQNLQHVTLNTLDARRGKAGQSPEMVLVVARAGHPRVPPWLRDLGEAQARRLHAGLAELTGKKVAFPRAYDAGARGRLMRSW